MVAWGTRGRQAFLFIADIVFKFWQDLAVLHGSQCAESGPWSRCGLSVHFILLASDSDYFQGLHPSGQMLLFVVTV